MRKNKILLVSSLAGLVVATTGAAYAAKGPGGGAPSPDRMFERMDLNKDGEITQEEISGAREARFKEADSNGDGLLSLDEMTAAREARSANRQQRRFEKLDANKDGFLSAEEMANSAHGKRHAQMFERADANEDGKITRTEAEDLHNRMRDRGSRSQSDD